MQTVQKKLITVCLVLAVMTMSLAVIPSTAFSSNTPILVIGNSYKCDMDRCGTQNCLIITLSICIGGYLEFY